MAPPEISARRASVGIVVAFLAPALLIYAGFTIYPVLRTFYNAFHAIKPQGVVEFVGLGNFATLLLTDTIFWKAVSNTATCGKSGRTARTASMPARFAVLWSGAR